MNLQVKLRNAAVWGIGCIVAQMLVLTQRGVAHSALDPYFRLFWFEFAVMLSVVTFAVHIWGYRYIGAKYQNRVLASAAKWIANQCHLLWHCADDRNCTFQFWDGRSDHELCHWFVCIDIADCLHPIYLGHDTNTKANTFMGVPRPWSSRISILHMAILVDDHFFDSFYCVVFPPVKVVVMTEGRPRTA